MDLEVFTYLMALFLGGICFLLVKRTADEFDHWYDEKASVRVLRVPVSVVSAAVSTALAGLIGVVSLFR